MAVRNITTLKAWFKTGDVPTQEQFGDLIDSALLQETLEIAANGDFAIPFQPSQVSAIITLTGDANITAISGLRIGVPRRIFVINSGDFSLTESAGIIPATGGAINVSTGAGATTMLLVTCWPNGEYRIETAITAPASAPIPITAPEITSAAVIGDTLAFTANGTWQHFSGTPVSRFEVFDADLSSWVALASGVTSIVAGANLVDRRVRGVQTATTTAGSSVQFSTETVITFEAPHISDPGEVAGSFVIGGMVTHTGLETTGGAAVITYTYFADGEALGNTGPSITWTAAHHGKSIDLEIRATNSGGSDAVTLMALGTITFAAPTDLGDLAALTVHVGDLVPVILDFGAKVNVPGDPALDQGVWSTTGTALPSWMVASGRFVTVNAPPSTGSATSYTRRYTIDGRSADIAVSITAVAESINADAAAAIARLTSPTVGYQRAINRFFKRLLTVGKTASNYDYIYGQMDTRTNFAVNLANSGLTQVVVGTGTAYTAGVGLIGGDSSHMGPGVAPGSLSRCVEGSAFVGGWVEVEDPPVSGVPALNNIIGWATGTGALRLRLAPIGNTSGNMVGRLFGGGDIVSAGVCASRRGFFAMTRTGTGGSSQFAMYNAAVSASAVTQIHLGTNPSQPPSSQTGFISFMRSNLQWAVDKLGFSWAGDYHTPAQVQGFLQAIQEFRAAIAIDPATVVSAGTLTASPKTGRLITPTGTVISGAGAVKSFQYLRNTLAAPTVFDPIGTATSESYLAVETDKGLSVKLQVTASNGTGTPDVKTTPAVLIGGFEQKVVFDPDTRVTSPNVTISNGNQVISTVAAYAVANADRWFTPQDPPFYFEVIVPGGLAANIGAYVAITSYYSKLNTSPDVGPALVDTTGFTLGGDLFGAPERGANKLADANRAAGDRVMVCVDPAQGRVWFGFLSRGWSGNPERTGTGAMSGYASLCEHAMRTVRIAPRSTAGNPFTLVSESSGFAGAPPAGYVPYAEIRAYGRVQVPRKIDDFMEYLGVCIHLDWRQSVFGTTVWRQPMRDLRIRNVRTTIGNGMDDALAMIANGGLRYNVLCAAESNYTYSSPHPLAGEHHEPVYEEVANSLRNASGAPSFPKPSIQENIADIAASLPPYNVIGFEGPNEPGTSASTLGWADRAMSALKYTHDTKNAYPALASIPGIATGPFNRSRAGGKMQFDAANALTGGTTGMAAIADRACAHYYCNGGTPYQGTLTQGLSNNSSVQLHIDQVLAEQQALTPGKPMWITEYGHSVFDPTSDADGTGKADQRFIDTNLMDEMSSANYWTRGAFAFFGRIERLFLYALIDNETTNKTNFGLCAQNSTSTMRKRASYYAFQRIGNMFSELNVPVTLVNASMCLTGNLSETEYSLFQKSDGSYYLAIWYDAKVWKRAGAASEAISMPDRDVHLVSAREIASITRYVPVPNTGAADAANAFGTVIAVAGNGREADLVVDESVTIFRITLA